MSGRTVKEERDEAFSRWADALMRLSDELSKLARNIREAAERWRDLN